MPVLFQLFTVSFAHHVYWMTMLTVEFKVFVTFAHALVDVGQLVHVLVHVALAHAPVLLQPKM